MDLITDGKFKIQVIETAKLDILIEVFKRIDSMALYSCLIRSEYITLLFLVKLYA